MSPSSSTYSGGQALRVINSVAPIRIADNGGWTDTWFAGHGSIFNIAVYPYAEVQVHVFPVQTRPHRVVINAENYGERYGIDPAAASFDRHPLLESAIRHVGVPTDVAVEVSIYSEAPAGASTGTSAAVSVALLGALYRLAGRITSPLEVAYAAHHVETVLLGLQCGIQDQLSCAHGGINYIEMDRFPHAEVTPLTLPDATWWELERRLALIYLGRSHASSEVHRMVIRSLEEEGGGSPRLEALRRLAPASRDALLASDFRGLGRAMIDNTEAQRRLHPRLVSSHADDIIRIAAAHGAEGWKVNGAGGDGGSLTILCGPVSQSKRRMVEAIEQADPLFRSIPIYLSRRGLRVWEDGPA